MADNINKISQGPAHLSFRTHFGGFTHTNSQRSLGGFTIIELLMATTVFSIVLLLAISGFIGIGQAFFKGVSNSQAQQVARQTIDDIAGNIRAAPTISSQQTYLPPGGGRYLYYCINNIRYTHGHDTANIPIMFDGGKPVNYSPGSAGANFGLLKDKLPGSSACAKPCLLPADGCVQFNSPQELLDSKMRVGDLDIHVPLAGGTDNLFLVSLDVAYGDESSMVFDTRIPGHVKIQCSGHISTQQYCGVTTLSTAVYSGIHP